MAQMRSEANTSREALRGLIESGVLSRACRTSESARP
jgi:hypothetical protein